MTPKHYNNEKGSIYKFCDDHNLNTWESGKTFNEVVSVKQKISSH